MIRLGRTDDFLDVFHNSLGRTGKSDMGAMYSDPEQRPLHRPAGAGKSAIAQTVAEQYATTTSLPCRCQPFLFSWKTWAGRSEPETTTAGIIQQSSSVDPFAIIITDPNVIKFIDDEDAKSADQLQIVLDAARPSGCQRAEVEWGWPRGRHHAIWI